MRTLKTFFILCLIACYSWSTQAQSLTSKGTFELGGEFSFSSQSYSESRSVYSTNSGSESSHVLMFNPYIGVMVAQGFELGFMPGIATSGDVTSLNLFFAPAYNISTGGNAVPYFEGLIGYSSLSDGSSISGLGVGISGGVKVTLGSGGLFLFNLKYLHQSYEQDRTYYSIYPTYSSGSYKSTININTIFAGIGFRIFIVSKSAKGNK